LTAEVEGGPDARAASGAATGLAQALSPTIAIPASQVIAAGEVLAFLFATGFDMRILQQRV
jgi:hypothetical protein